MRNKIFFIFLVLFIAGSAIYSWYRYLYLQDYLTYTQTPCDPLTESCFTYMDTECEGDECVSFYKVTVVPAYLLKECVPDEGQCVMEKCSQSKSCEIITCSQTSRDTMEIEDECSL